MASGGAAVVTVMGGGIFGLACAWECARRGARVRLVERDRIGAGSSGGIVGALAPHVPENWNPKKAFQLASLVMSEGFWAEVALASGINPGYARAGRLQPIADAAALELARARAEGAQALWPDFAEWRVVPASSVGDWAPHSPTGWLIRDTLSARLHPRRAAEALETAIRALGGTVALGQSAPGDATGRVIWATGAAGLADLSAALDRDVGGGVKGQATLLAHDARDLPQLFADGIHVVPHGDGTVAVGSTAEREFDDPASVDARLDAIIAKARTAVPALAGAKVIERWAGVRPRARSRAPMLGAWPDRPGHFVANGGFKIGYGMAPMVAKVMADLVLDGQDAIPQGFRVEDSL